MRRIGFEVSAAFSALLSQGVGRILAGIGGKWLIVPGILFDEARD
jgi:hypothetical protein